MSRLLPGRVWTAVRAPDWWAYKIPPLVAIACAALVRFESAPGAWVTPALAIAAILCVAVYGYVLNDICDVEADRLSQRPNRMASVGPAGRAIGLLLPTAAAGALAWQIGDPILAALLGVNLLLPSLYSVPPIRLKGRGLLGALADAAGVHAVPAAVAARAATMNVSDSDGAVTAFVWLSTGWALVAGLRGIIFHQTSDLRDDQRAGVGTFVGSLGVVRARRLVVSALLPIEILSLGIWLALILPWSHVATVAVAIGLAIDALRMRRGWTLPLFESPDRSRERHLPIVNNELYEVWLPFGLAADLALRQPPLWGLIVLMIVAFGPNARRRLTDVRALLRPARDGQPSSARTPRQRAHEYQVVIAATAWSVNGVNVFSANLARGLGRIGRRAHVLLTEENTELIDTRERSMPRPEGVTFGPLPVAPVDGWGRHWGAMLRYLEEAAPCIYIPNSDWRHSSVCPRLSNGVVVVGIVHSDDPLHYDHVRRLGPYWNAVVAVSKAVAKRAVEVSPTIADRIVTIPIGVRIPNRLPVREPRSGPLRVIYHGVLKQHQKRVLDLPRIADAALALGVSVELTIAGAGPDEEALRAAAAPLVERGVIRFPGVVSPDDTTRLLENQDVYLLASEFEGMPNALIEAMGRGCVPVVSRMTSGIPELVRDGDNGFLAPIGDVGAFARQLQVLANEPERRAAMSRSAFRTVSRGRFRVEDMVAAYAGVFDHAWRQARRGRFIRPRGPLSHPPAEVAGVSLFPVPLPHVVAGVGAFPSAEDAAEFADDERLTDKGPEGERARARLRAHGLGSQLSLQGVRVVVAAPVWTPNGVNLLSEDLVRGLRLRGLDARLLLTEEVTSLVQIDQPRMARPTDIPVEELRVEAPENWGARWGAMVRTLASEPSCFYLPGFDWRHACVVPAIPDGVNVVGAVHDDEGLYLEQASRLGASWNAVVATSRALAGYVRANLPELADRMSVIPHGFAVPTDLVPRGRRPDGGALVLVVGCKADGEGGLSWLTGVLEHLRRLVPAWRVVVVDPPESLHESLSESGAEVARWLNRQQWLEFCASGDFVLAPAFGVDTERAVVEAMGHGAIPIVRAVMPDREIRIDAGDGIVAADAEAGDLVTHMQTIAGDDATRQAMGERAHRAARRAGYHTDRMIDDYVELFRNVVAEREAGFFRRTPGPILPPPPHVGGASLFPVPLEHDSSLGRFPSTDDEQRFCLESGIPLPVEEVRAP